MFLTFTVLMVTVLMVLLFSVSIEGEKTKVSRWARASDTCAQQSQANWIISTLQAVQTKLNEIEQKVDKCHEPPSQCLNGDPKNCAEVLACGGTTNGVYMINPDDKDAFPVYCDQTTKGGCWTVFQKRQDGSVDFYRGWVDYKNGFGDPRSEYWLGLDKVNRLTNQGRNKLLVYLEDTTGASAYAEYGFFAVSAEASNYRLSLGTYSGTAGDSLSGHSGHPFTTKDRDNDAYGGNCALLYRGAWWYTSCHDSNLNGAYHLGNHSSRADGVNWYTWKGYHYSARRAEMMMRPQNFVVPQ